MKVIKKIFGFLCLFECFGCFIFFSQVPEDTKGVLIAVGIFFALLAFLLLKKPKNTTPTHPEQTNTDTLPENTTANPQKKFYKKPWFWIIIIFVLVIGISLSPNQEPTNNNDNQQQQDTDQQSDDTPKTLSDEEKNSIIELDSQIVKIITDSESTTTNLQTYLTAFGQQQATLLDVYNAAKTAKDIQFNHWQQLNDLQNDSNKDYIGACQLYVGIHQSFAENLLKYIDKNKIEYLSKAQENLSSCSDYALLVATGRMKWLTDQGLTTEEVSNILTSTPE